MRMSGMSKLYPTSDMNKDNEGQSTKERGKEGSRPVQPLAMCLSWLPGKQESSESDQQELRPGTRPC